MFVPGSIKRPSRTDGRSGTDETSLPANMLVSPWTAVGCAIGAAVFVGLGRENAKMARMEREEAAAAAMSRRAMTRPLSGRRTLSLYDRLQLSSLRPFVNRTRVLPAAQRLVMAVVAAFLFLPRLCLFVTGIVAYALLSAALDAGTDPSKALPPARARLLSLLGTPIRRAVFFALGFHRITQSGSPAPRHVAPVVVANHTTFADVLLLHFHASGGVSKAENARIPLVGAMARAVRCVFVDRSSSDSRAAALAALRARAADHSWPRVVLFPEGTTTNGSTLAVFKVGAFAPAATVQPVLLRYAGAPAFPAFQTDPTFVRGGPQLPGLLVRLFSSPFCSLHMQYLDPVVPTADEKRDPVLFATRTRAIMAETLGVPLAQFSFDDTVMMVRRARPPVPTHARARER